MLGRQCDEYMTHASNIDGDRIIFPGLERIKKSKKNLLLKDMLGHIIMNAGQSNAFPCQSISKKNHSTLRKNGTPYNHPSEKHPIEKMWELYKVIRQKSHYQFEVFYSSHLILPSQVDGCWAEGIGLRFDLWFSSVGFHFGFTIFMKISKRKMCK